MQRVSHPVYSFQDFTLDLSRGYLLHGAREVKLRNKSLEVLTYLVQNRGRLVGKDELIGAVWPDSFVSDESVTQCLMEIRRALGDDSQRYVRTVPRRGYLFDVEVKESGKEDVLKAEPPEAEGGENKSPKLDEISAAEGEGDRIAIHEQRETNGESNFAKVEEPPEAASQSANGVDISEDKRRSQARPRITVMAVLLGAVFSAAVLLALYLRPSLPPPKVLRYVQITNDGQQKLAPSLYTQPLLTDGSRLYCSEFRGGHFILVQVSTTGGETVPLMTPFRHVFPSAISPNRSELLVAMDQRPGLSLWLFPLLGGSARRLTDLPAMEGDWSRDGQEMVYVGDDSSLYLARGDGSDPRKLVSVPNLDGWVRWSPDGSILRFSLYDPGTDAHSLWEVSADGTNLHPLLPGWNKPSSECCGDWTPDGKYFLFQARREGMTNIWAIQEKGGLFRKPSRQPVQLTAGPMSFFAPLPSPDGKKLFVVGVQPRGELARYDAKSHEFVPYLSGISAEHLDFSRDGEWIAYVAYPEGTLWRRRVDGSQRLELTFPPMRAVLPRWSPDGKQIAFMASLPGKPWKIYLVSAEGGSPQQLIPGDRSEQDPSWSPDGNSLAFGRSWPKETLAVEILDLKTRQVATLPGSKGRSAPLWSHDGRYIAATGNSGKLALFDSTAQNWVDLADSCGFYKSWSRDGKHLYIDGPSGDERAIFRVGILDRTVERVASLRDFPQVFGTWATWFGLAPDDSPLLLRSVGTQEVYAIDWEAP